MKEIRKINASKMGIFILCVLTPIFVYIMGKSLPKLPYSQMSMDAFWANKISNDKKYDIVFIGDSRIYRGINPEIISKITKAKTLNYGFSAAGLDSTLIISAIKQLNKSGKKIIVFGISPSTFTEESSKNEHFKSLKRINQKDVWIRKNIYPNLNFFNPYSLSEIKKAINHEAYYQNCYSDGFIYSNKIPSDSFEAVKSYSDYFNRTSISEIKIRAFLNLANQLTMDGYQCYAFRVPVALPLYNLENTVFNVDTFKKELGLVGIQWLNIPQNGYISYDGSHLTGTSANKLSTILGDSILKYH